MPSLPTVSLPGSPRRRARSRRFVVCGENPLAYRLTDELVTRFAAEVTVVVRSRTADRAPQIAELPGVTVLEAAHLDDATLRKAGVARARALALVESDDVGNIHAALRAHDLNPRLNLVIRMFNMRLGHRIRTQFQGTVSVLSDAATAAPSFVAAALGEVAPSHIRLPGRTLFVAHRSDVPARQVLCGLADTDSSPPRLLPADPESADLVLAGADGAPRNPLGEHRTSRRRVWWRRVRLLLGNNLVRAALTLFGLLVAGALLLATAGRGTVSDAVYLALLDAAGDANPDTGLSVVDRVAQVGLSLVGLAIIPVFTAAVVDGVVRARLAEQGGVREGLADHVVVVGLGHVGGRVVTQLHDLGVAVVGVESDEHAAGVAIAREHGVPVVVGDATRDDTLRSASIGTSRALLLLTSTDAVNLEAALLARTHREDLRVVLRLFDDDLAARMERVFGIAASRSVSSLAAAEFAAAMVQRRVIGTIPIGRQVLLVAEVPVVAGAALHGRAPRAADEAGEVRVIAVARRSGQGPGRIDWAPDPAYRLAVGDRVTVLATRRGLARLLADSDVTIAPGPGESATG